MTKSTFLTALSRRDAAYAALLTADIEIAKRGGAVLETWKAKRQKLYRAWRREVKEYKKQYAQMRREIK